MAGARVVQESASPHEAGALAGAIARVAPQSDLVIVFGASAITDRRDVIPAAVEAADGVIEHFGMPVDPGNLLLIGALPDGKPILGAPGCARSPAENGFDWVLHAAARGAVRHARRHPPHGRRRAADGDRVAAAIARARAWRASDMSEIAAVVLAAGRASRFGAGEGDSKVLARLDGKPLARHVVGGGAGVAGAAGPRRHRPCRRGRARGARPGWTSTFVDNPHAASGMAEFAQGGRRGAAGGFATGALILARRHAARAGGDARRADRGLRWPSEPAAGRRGAGLRGAARQSGPAGPRRCSAPSPGLMAMSGRSALLKRGAMCARSSSTIRACIDRHRHARGVAGGGLDLTARR
jgi:molybdenum cofactor cytidylyltransferase